MRYPQGCDYQFLKPCIIAAKYRHFGGSSIFALLLGYVLMRALKHALPFPLLGVAFHFDIGVISTWCKNLALDKY
jgi:tetrahydromethanopterin S-methyltransferase subunit E